MASPPYPFDDVEAQKEKGLFPRHVTIENALPELPRHIYDERTHSHEVIESEPRIPVEFRTLSIHVDTKPDIEPTGGKNSRRRTKDVKDLASLDWHRISIDDALQRLSVSVKVGLDSAQAHRRAHAYGKNAVSPPKQNMLRKVLEWLLGGFGSLLLAASIVCFIAWKPLGNPDPQASNLALAVVLLVVLFVQAGFNAWQDFSTSKVMASITGMLPSQVLVLRDSGQTSIAAEDLVPGDLVYISLGEKIPADLKLIDTSGDLHFDRSVLTGESEPISARLDMTDENFLESKNIALQGTHCVGGSGIGLVIQTGDNTVFGRIAKLSSGESSGMTTLQREILRLVLIIAGLATAVAILIVILWAAWLRRDHPSYINVSGLLIDVVSVMVAFIPEGLPVAVTLSLAKIAHTLSKHKVLCKSLSIVETLGSVNVLCSDKTGTLTQNKMHVENLAVFDSVYVPADHRQTVAQSSSDVAANLAQVAAVGAICNGASFGASTEEKADISIVGDATDTAILRFADSVLPVQETRSLWREVFKMSFNSKTKFMLKLSRLAVAVPGEFHMAPIAPWDNFHHSDYLLTIKGAPEVLLSRCGYVLDPTGGPPIPVTAAVLVRIAAIQEKWAQGGQRVLLLARRVISENMLPKGFDPQSDDFEDTIAKLNTDLVIVGLLGLVDPLKPSISHVVKTCRRAGIRFFVVTGDHPTTAVSIAAQAGIISNRNTIHHMADLDPNQDVANITLYNPDLDEQERKGIVITGAEIDKLTPPQVEQLCQYQEIVFARTTPEQKLWIVRELQRRENVVAMTGDGVNDAPSLKAADCGIAMGQGSDVAREAADMVLLDDFSAIIVALEYGRLVYDNLKKTVLYLLPAGSFSELMPILLNVIIGVPQMLSNIQMILICVATDVLPALSLCLEPSESGLLERKPRNVKTERLVDWRLLLHAYGLLGVIESLCAMSMSFWYLQSHGVPFSSLVLGFGNWPGLDNHLLFRAQSVYFFTLVLMQWGNLFATRGRKLSIFQHTPSKNWFLFPAAAIALCIGIFFCYVPWFQKIFQTRMVPVEFFFIPLTFSLALLLLDEARKVIVRTYPRSIVAFCAW